MKKRNILQCDSSSPQPGTDLWELKERVQIDQHAPTHTRRRSYRYGMKPSQGINFASCFSNGENLSA